MLTNAEITIFNCFPDKDSKKFVYIPHYIPSVWFHTDQKISVTSGGMVSADSYQIRIPRRVCEGWLPPEEFNSSSYPMGRWTVQNDDLFIVGQWYGSMQVSGIEEIKREFSGVVGKVLSHSENFFGSSPHIRIGGGV